MPEEVRKKDHAGKENQERRHVRRERQPALERFDHFYDDGIVDEIDDQRALSGRPQGIHERELSVEMIKSRQCQGDETGGEHQEANGRGIEDLHGYTAHRGRVPRERPRRARANSRKVPPPGTGTAAEFGFSSDASLSRC